MFWNTVYAPSLDSSFPSISRQWAIGFGGWMVGEWDCFFGALLTSLEESKQTTAAHSSYLDGANRKWSGAECGFRFRNYSRTFAASCGLLHYMEGLSTDARPFFAGVGVSSPEEVARVVVARPWRWPILERWES